MGAPGTGIDFTFSRKLMDSGGKLKAKANSMKQGSSIDIGLGQIRNVVMTVTAGIQETSTTSLGSGCDDSSSLKSNCSSNRNIKDNQVLDQFIGRNVNPDGPDAQGSITTSLGTSRDNPISRKTNRNDLDRKELWQFDTIFDTDIDNKQEGIKSK